MGRKSIEKMCFEIIFARELQNPSPKFARFGLQIIKIENSENFFSILCRKSIEKMCFELILASKRQTFKKICALWAKNNNGFNFLRKL